MLIIFSLSRWGFTDEDHRCFNFPRAHQANIRPDSRRAAFTEQIRLPPPHFFLETNFSSPQILDADKLLATPPPAPPRRLPNTEESEWAIQSKEQDRNAVSTVEQRPSANILRCLSSDPLQLTSSLLVDMSPIQLNSDRLL